jgi:excisionase family DNA binding protein
MENGERDFTRTEAAERLGVAEVTLDRLIRAGRFSAYRVGRRVFVSRIEIETYLDECRRRQIAAPSS